MISLKAYNREIEQLIDNGLYDDAIAHSIHILLTYPKCIDSYRNLGKSLLEQKKYPEALDVFSRVLSAIPDDFISHVGLSIIFEDQNNLDLAIWHMEQAFDVQPSNLAIQDELKRLFEHRDGEPPAKIRLTRGALVRMYARGELFQQAISEIQSILEEDPRRIDLEVILAKMHYSSGAIEEAEAGCNRILEKIPYCFEANRILQQIHLSRNNIEAATINMNRLISMDPYYQFTASPFSETEIPENKVQLVKLDYISTNKVESQIPAWLEEVDQSSVNEASESLNWLNDQTKSAVSNTAPLDPPLSVENHAFNNEIDAQSAQSDDDIPEWIKSAGWNSNSEFASLETDSSLLISQPEIENGISESLSDHTHSVNLSSVTNDDLASLFTELKEGIMDDEKLVSNGNEEKQFPPPEWKSQFSNSEEAISQSPTDQDFPDWLKNFQAEEPQTGESTEDMPDWLKNLQSEAEPESQSTFNGSTESSVEEIKPEATTFDNIFVNEVESETTAPIDEIPHAISDQDDGWEKIDLLTTKSDESQASNIETGELKPISSDDKIPEWVKSVLNSQNAADEALQINNAESDIENLSISDEQLETPSVSLESSHEVSNSDEGIISQQTNDELLDWLRGLKIPEESSLPIEDPTISLENSVDDEIDKDQALLQESQITDDSESPESLLFNVLDDELNNQSNDKSASETELISEQPVDKNHSDFTDVEYTEYANEMTDTPSMEEPVELNNPSQLPKEMFSENAISNLSELLETGDFNSISTTISKLSPQSQEIEQLTEQLTSTVQKNGNNYAYWQCLGDIHSKNNQLNEALLAYQKAEDILLKTISK